MTLIAAGTVTSVDSKAVATTVEGFAAAGTSAFFVNDNADFTPGDQVLITTLDATEGELYVVGAVDDEAGITLTSPLMEDAPEGTWVALYPLQFETRATVRLVESGEVAECIVLHTLADALRPGIRDESTSESVLTVEVGDDRYVFDIVARQTIRDVSEALPGVPPAKPDAPVLSTLAYLDTMKQLRAQITAAWSPVTTNVDGSDITDLDHYEVDRKGATGSWQTYTSTPGDITQAFIRDLEPGSVWSVRVRAVDTSKNASEWSDPATITAATDDLPPAQPSRPVVTSRLGVITITWDGKNATGGGMDDDLAYVEVHLSTSNGFTPSAATKVDQIPRAASVVWGPAAFGSTYYVRFVAVDTSGNVSPASLQQSTNVAALVDVSNFPDTAMQVLYARTGHFIQLDADQITSNSAAIGFLETGQIIGAIFEARDGGEFRTNATPTNGGIRIRDADGLKAWANGGGTPTVEIDRATGKLTARSADITGAIKAGSTITGTDITGSSFATASVAGYGSVALDSGRIAFGTGGQLHQFSSSVFLLGPGGGLSISLGSIDFALSGTTRLSVTSDGITVPNRATANRLTLTNPDTIDAGGGTALRISDAGLVSKATSSIRYKSHIHDDYVIDSLVEPAMALRNRRYRRRDAPGDRWYHGFIAEEAHELGLGAFVGYNADGSQETFNHDYFAAIVHHAVLRNHHPRIAELERQRAEDRVQIERLLARIEDLEAA